MKLSIDRKTVETWFTDETGRSTDWVEFWSFLTLTVDKCLESRGTAEAASRGVQWLYNEIYKEVMVVSFVYIQSQ